MVNYLVAVQNTRERSHKMTSKYYEAAEQSYQKELFVAKANEKKLAALEERMKAIRAKENKAIANIKLDEKKKLITTADRMIEEAQVHARAYTEAVTIKAQIRTIVPDWREDLMGKAKVLSDKAALATVRSADVSGKGLGVALRTPFQAGKRFFGSIKQRAGEEFAAFNDEISK